MRMYHQLMSCVAFGSLIGAAPAFAQDAAPQPAAEPENEIIVTGFRAALAAAQDIKRQASSVLEAITLEDLGKFTDTSISEALKRVPGVQIEKLQNNRNGGTDNATIRGLSGSTTTLNGRIILGNSNFTGEGLRRFDLSSVPPEILGGVNIYKTSTAAQVEPGLAGQIDLQTLRPLDYATAKRQRLFGTLAVSSSYGNGSKELSPRIGGVIGGSLFEDTLGVYVSALFSKDVAVKNENLVYNDPTRSNITVRNPDGSLATVNNVRTFNGLSTWTGNTKDEKRSLATGFQWKPSSNFEVNAELLYNKFKTARDDQTSYIDFSTVTNRLGRATTIVNSDSIVLVGPAGDKAIAAIDTAGVNSSVNALRNGVYNYASYYRLRNELELTNFGFNGKYKSDDGGLIAILDYSRTDQSSLFRWVSPYVINNGTEGRADIRGPQRVTFDTATAATLLDTTTYTSFGGFDEVFEKQTKASRDAVRLDVDLRIADELRLKFGTYYQQTNANYVSMNTRLQPNSLVGYFSNRSTQLPLFKVPTPQVNFAAFCKSNAAFCNQRNNGKGSFVNFPTTSAGSPTDVLGFDSGLSFKVLETNTAFYGQADANTELFGMDFSGNAGARLIRITFEGTAIPGVRVRNKFSNDPVLNSGVPDRAITGTNRYWKLLPSANFTFKPTDDINVRFAAARTLSPADYRELSPLGGATVYNDNSVNQFNEFRGGNPLLKPTTAWNYDATFEYYTNYGGAFIASFFYKDVKNLTVTDTLQGVTIPGLPGLFISSTTVNRGKGYTYGFELSTNQPLTFLPSPFDGFGFQANYTNITSKVDQGVGSSRFPGFSKYSVNLTGYYEKYGWAARVSYLYRPEVFLFRTSNADGAFFDTVRPPRASLDASLSKELFGNFELIVTGTNLTGADLQNVRQPYGLTAEYNRLSPVYSLGVRASF